MSKLNIGDVILNNGMSMVIIDYINREDMSSVSYDRSYKVCLVSELQNRNVISQEDFEKLGYWIEVRGINFPEIEIDKDIAPFEIIPIKSYKVRQKQAKTITVYE